MTLREQLEMDTLRAKAEAYDKGVEMWEVKDQSGSFVAIDETPADVWFSASHLSGPDQETLRKRGFTCRKVRVCEEVSQ